MSSNEKKLIVFEGIPGGGKTSIFMEMSTTDLTKPIFLVF